MDHSPLSKMPIAENIEVYRLSPERYLVLGILTQALKDCCRKAESVVRADAIRWLMSDSVEPFSFIWSLSVIKEGLEFLAKDIAKMGIKGEIADTEALLRILDYRGRHG